MNDIDVTLKAFDYFHDWYVDSIALQGNEASTCPDTLTLVLSLADRRVSIAFAGMTRLGIENGGTVNIVLSMEEVQPNTEVNAIAQRLLKQSLRGKRTAQHVVYLHPTAGFAIAVEFDFLAIKEGA
ncbi:hypothetical protein [Caballeronia sp. Lep1P3]|uniref:hypothetical protein n=1 Tax=Caballeronia sp. Lep1P3 TaxID=2878150 RepID=UPI001FD49AD5|nr:hypothetical protein [Caballeronia sp. Lep1P3]